jgi:hypothetical protein
MSALAATPVAPRTVSRGSDSWTPNISQQASSPKMSSQVPAETPVGRRLTSTIVMKRIVDDRPYPTRPPAGARPPAAAKPRSHQPR